MRRLTMTYLLGDSFTDAAVRASLVLTTDVPLIQLRKNKTAARRLLNFSFALEGEMDYVHGDRWNAVVEAMDGSAVPWLDIISGADGAWNTTHRSRQILMANLTDVGRTKIVVAATAWGLSESADSNPYEARISVYVSRPSESMPSPAPVPRYLMASTSIRVVVVAEADAQQCTLAVQPHAPIFATIDHPKGFEFVARDFEGLPLARGGEIFEATLYACAGSRSSGGTRRA